MTWSIVTDSSCDYQIDRDIPDNISIAEVPFIISVGSKDYVDTPDLDVSAMLDDMDACKEASRTACPAPGAWYELFEKTDCTIAVTISSNLSGSYNSAVSARDMVLEKYPEKKIFILDSLSAGSVLSMYVELAIELIEKGHGFEEVILGLEGFAKERHTIFALASFNNLVKNGRVSKLSGFIAGKLGIWGIGIASPQGTIIVKSKTRGIPHVLSAFIDDMKENGFKGGYVIISHCRNHELAQELRKKIVELWESTKVKILETGGLCSFYAEKRGMIVAY